MIIFISFFRLSSVLYPYSSYYITPSLLILVWLLPHSSKTHPSKIFKKNFLSKLQKLMSMELVIEEGREVEIRAGGG